MLLEKAWVSAIKELNTNPIIMTAQMLKHQLKLIQMITLKNKIVLVKISRIANKIPNYFRIRVSKMIQGILCKLSDKRSILKTTKIYPLIKPLCQLSKITCRL